MTTVADPNASAFDFALGSNRFDNHPQTQHARTFDDLQDAILAARHDRTKDEAPYVSRPFMANGGGLPHRLSENALPVAWLALDVDALPTESVDALHTLLTRWRGFWHSSMTATAENCKQRVVLALSRIVTPEEHPRVVEAVEAAIKQRVEGIELDPASADTARMWYLPTTTAAAGAFTEGEPVDVDALLAQMPPGEEHTASDVASVVRYAEGGRNSRLTRDAGSLRRLGFSATIIEAALRQLNAERCEPPLPSAEVRTIAHSVARYDPPALPVPINLLSKIAAPPLTVDDVPPLIGDYAAYQAEATGIDFTAYALAGTVATAAMIDDGISVLLRSNSGWFESARLWGVMVGSPGAGKTPAMRAMLRPVYAKHRELVAEYVRVLSTLTDDDDPPPRPALYTSDTTVEALSKILEDNPRGILFIAEEFESWIGSHDAYRSGAGSRDRGEWLRLYDGGPHQINRVQRGAVFVPNWGASIIAGTTFAALRKLAKHLPTDGLPQRFIMLAVRPMQTRGAETFEVEERRAREPYEDRLRTLYGYPGDRVVKLSLDAKDVFRAEEDAIRALVGATEAWSEAFAAHVAKHVAMLARVALTFHVLTVSEHPADTPLGADTVRLAARFMRKVFAHGMAIYTDAFGAGSALEVARAVARSILVGGADEVNRRALAHACRAWRDADKWQQEAALQTLLDAGWLVPRDGDQRPTDYRVGWIVNPAVHALFEAEAEAARQRRSLVRDRLRDA